MWRIIQLRFTARGFGAMTWLDAMFGERCRLCGIRGASTIGPVTPTHPGDFATKDYSLRQCRSCETVYLHPLPTPADLSVLYEESVQFASDHYTDPEQVRRMLEYYEGELAGLDLLPAGPSRLLEIGAGLAWVSRAAKKRNSQIWTVAQDVSGECATACTWVDTYFVGTVDALTDRAPYDLVSLTHVIEHLPDPAAMLRTIAPLLRVGGKLFITAPFRPVGWHPSAGIDAWRTYSYLHVPAHITYFSERWFRQKAGALGLEIVHWNATHEGGQAFALVLQKSH